MTRASRTRAIIQEVARRAQALMATDVGLLIVLIITLIVSVLIGLSVGISHVGVVTPIGALNFTPPRVSAGGTRPLCARLPSSRRPNHPGPPRSPERSPGRFPPRRMLGRASGRPDTGAPR